MARFDREPISAEPEPTELAELVEPEQPRFDIDKALNTKGFTEFLTQFPDHDSLELDEGSKDEIEARFKTFEAKQEASKGLKEFYRGMVHEEAGIRIDDQELKSVDVFLDRAAIESPGEVTDVVERLRRMKERDTRITEKETEIRELTGGKGLDFAKQDIAEAIETWNKLPWKQRNWFFGKFFRTSNQKQVLHEFESTYGMSINHAKERLFALNEAERDRSATAARNKDEKHSFTYLEPAWTIKKIAQQKADEELAKLTKRSIETKSLTDMEREQKRFDELRGKDKELSFNYLGAPMRKNDEFQESLDTAIRGKIVNELVALIKDFRAEAKISNIYGAFERHIAKYAKKEKIGSSEGEEARAFIRETLSDILDAMGSGENAKRILLKRYITKLE